jgi:hypothetical protein
MNSRIIWLRGLRLVNVFRHFNHRFLLSEKTPLIKNDQGHSKAYRKIREVENRAEEYEIF